MGALSPMHLALVLVIALLVFGPKKLPEIGRELGRAIREFKKASQEVMESFHGALEDRPSYSAPASEPYDSYVYPEPIAPHAPVAGAPAAGEPIPAATVPDAAPDAPTPALAVPNAVAREPAPASGAAPPHHD